MEFALTKLVQLVEDAAEAREEPVVQRKFIEEALVRIENGQECPARYPTGEPSLKAVYEIATRLESAEARKQ